MADSSNVSLRFHLQIFLLVQDTIESMYATMDLGRSKTLCTRPECLVFECTRTWNPICLIWQIVKWIFFQAVPLGIALVPLSVQYLLPHTERTTQDTNDNYLRSHIGAGIHQDRTTSARRDIGTQTAFEQQPMPTGEVFQTVQVPQASSIASGPVSSRTRSRTSRIRQDTHITTIDETSRSNVASSSAGDANSGSDSSNSDCGSEFESVRSRPRRITSRPYQGRTGSTYRARLARNPKGLDRCYVGTSRGMLRYYPDPVSSRTISNTFRSYQDTEENGTAEEECLPVSTRTRSRISYSTEEVRRSMLEMDQLASRARRKA